MTTKTASSVSYVATLLHYSLLIAGAAYFIKTGQEYAVDYLQQLALQEQQSKLRPFEVEDMAMNFSQVLDKFNDEEYLANYTCNENHPYRLKITRRIPLMMEIENFLDYGEAEHLALSALPIFKRSTVAGYQQSDVRTSSTAFLPKLKDEVFRCVEERASRLVNLPVKNLEALQVVQYQEGQKYEPHHDWFDPAHESSSKELLRGKQRIITMFVYLNTLLDGEGGETYFPEIDYGVRPVKNKASLWFNVDVNGVEDRLTLHAGRPVHGREKWGLNVWFRQEEFI